MPQLDHGGDDLATWAIPRPREGARPIATWSDGGSAVTCGDPPLSTFGVVLAVHPRRRLHAERVVARQMHAFGPDPSGVVSPPIAT